MRVKGKCYKRSDCAEVSDASQDKFDSHLYCFWWTTMIHMYLKVNALQAFCMYQLIARLLPFR